MSYREAVVLDQLDESQEGKADTLNALLSALASAGIFGIKTSVTTGLTFGLYGGVMIIAGVPTVIASQTVTLTASMTNYIYSTSAGVVTKTTSTPTGWPAITSPVGAIALYELVVGSSTITSGTNYVPSLGIAGDTGDTGETGPEGIDMAGSRQRLWMPVGAGSTTVTYYGFDAVTFVGTATTARTLSSASLRESIPYAGYPTGAGAGSGAQVYATRAHCYRDSTAGRGGFTLSMRFCFESASSPANQRCFFGLYGGITTIGNVEPDTLVNIIGVGAKAGESNLSILYNDASGTATKTLLASDGSPTANFPARATDNVYELTLTAEPGSTTVSYSLVNLNTGDEATGVINSNLPTVFMGWVAWINNGSTASVAAMGLMQVVCETRY